MCDAARCAVVKGMMRIEVKICFAVGRPIEAFTGMTRVSYSRRMVRRGVCGNDERKKFPHEDPEGRLRE